MNEFETHRPLLFSIAYRMLGTAMEAEDMVQETWLRWQSVETTTVENPRAYLAKTVTRLSIDYLKQARVQREEYIGPWLPEPIIADGSEDMLALSDSLSFAFLVMLESLTPIERAVLLLREVFEYEYEEIGDVVGKSVTNCRQILRRARQQVKARRPRFDTAPEDRDRVLASFMMTCGSGDMDGLMAILDEDIVLWSDGGGKATAARKPVRGSAKVARLLFGLVRTAGDSAETSFAIVNNQPALISRFDGELGNIFLFHIEDGQLQHIYSVRNPDKLAAISQQLA